MDEKARNLNRINSMIATVAQLKRDVEAYYGGSSSVDFRIHAGGAIEVLEEVFEREANTVRES